jgi:hypothetical protein
MPFLALRNFSTQPLGRIAISKPARKRIRLSILNIPKRTKDDHGEYGLQEAHISLAIVGIDHDRWVCYCFVDTEIGNPNPDEQGHEDPDEEAEDDDDENKMKEDPIFSDGQGDEVPEADNPIWYPREYFVRVVVVRMKQILREWENVVHAVRESVNDWVIFLNRPFAALTDLPQARCASVRSITSQRKMSCRERSYGFRLDRRNYRHFAFSSTPFFQDIWRLGQVCSF